MKFVDQTVLHSKYINGNCFAACVASMFNVPIEEQPDFTNMDEFEWFIEFEKWIEREFGLELLRFSENACPTRYYMVLGQSPRGLSHAVIYKDGELAHDPHPDKTGLKEITSVWVFIPLDLSEFIKS